MPTKNNAVLNEIDKLQQKIYDLDRVYLVEKTTYVSGMEGQTERVTKTWSGFANLDCLLGSKQF